MTLEYVKNLKCDVVPLSLGVLGLPFHHVFSDASPKKHQCPGLKLAAHAATSLAQCKQISVLPFLMHSVSWLESIDMSVNRSTKDVWILPVQILLNMLLDVKSGST